MTSSTLMPVTLIGGYLGSGKTALVNHLLSTRQQKRFAVLVNDFGDLNIDSELIAGDDAPVVPLLNGCVCCVVGDDLGAALAAVVSSGAEHLLVEASGVADTGKLTATFRSWPGFRVQSVLSVVDVRRIASLLQDKFVGQHIHRQLRWADQIILTRTSEYMGDLEQLRGQLSALTPAGFHFMDALPDELLDLTGELLADDSPYSHPVHGSHSFECSEPLCKAQMMKWLQPLRAKKLRIKGVLHLAEDPNYRYVLQVVDADIQLYRDRPWGGDAPKSRVLAIGPVDLVLTSPWA